MRNNPIEYTIHDLIDVKKQYRKNFEMLEKTVGTDEHKKYVKIEKELNKKELQIMRHLKQHRRELLPELSDCDKPQDEFLTFARCLTFIGAIIKQAIDDINGTHNSFGEPREMVKQEAENFIYNGRNLERFLWDKHINKILNVEYIRRIAKRNHESSRRLLTKKRCNSRGVENPFPEME